MGLIFDKSSKGKNSLKITDGCLDEYYSLSGEYENSSVDLPDVNETEVVRHYTALSTMNFGVDNGMYPLGSCTMKYNPKINEKLAMSSSFSEIHPLCGDEYSQGCLQVMHELNRYLCEITGMQKFSLSPAAGSHGELAGVMIIKKYFEKINDPRKIILIPDSAHGTNPASVAMGGFEVMEVVSSPEGDVDIEDLKSKLGPDVAAMMLTSPNTLGLFDRNIEEISNLLHENGSLFYCDGANLNAVIAKAGITAMGFDLMHINLHKTFSTPHGGGGPGSGPVGVVEKLAAYLPLPDIEYNDGMYSLVNERPDSIGYIHSFYGNFLVALKAYMYILSLGPEGLKKVSETAVLNANYLLSGLSEYYNLPIDRNCMHEFVLNDKGLPEGITTNEIAKRLLDKGFHAPTIYFPLLVHGAMMIEPTETESLASLDSFIQAMIEIKKEAAENPELLKNAPSTTPVKKIDAVLAARKPVLKWAKM